MFPASNSVAEDSQVKVKKSKKKKAVTGRHGEVTLESRKMKGSAYNDNEDPD